MALQQLWRTAFLDFRPSTSLGLFRIAVAWTVGCHVIPSFFHMADNYLATAFRTQNRWFFPEWALALASATPDWLVWSWAGIFLTALALFAVGWRAQASCIAMTAACYFFYARNPFHIGTLSFDILLVTLALMCVTGFHGDFLSVDSLRSGNVRSYKRPRPYFLQRLLQLQLVFTFWHTALNKFSAGGNWLTDNPYYYLMHYPPLGVVRDFPLRDTLAGAPGLCYAIGIGVIVMELATPLLWLVPRTRPFGIAVGILFQLLLWATLHVPTIFLFLFPPMMLLFIRPESVVRWIEARQALRAERGRAILLYDGQCGFCLASVNRLRILDVFGWIDPLDFHLQPDVSRLHPALTPERCRSQMVLVEPNGAVSGGFDAFARMTRSVALLWWAWSLVRLPGVPNIGRRVYRWVASNRKLIHRDASCQSNRCALPAAASPANN